MTDQHPHIEPARTPEETDLQGWPGYRTREGRSGLDPIDNNAEAGHVLGVLLRQFFTVQLRTHNPGCLLLLALFGLVALIPLTITIGDLLNSTPPPIQGWIYLLVATAFGVAALANLFASLRRRPH